MTTPRTLRNGIVVDFDKGRISQKEGSMELTPKPAAGLVAAIETALTGPAHERLVVVEYLAKALDDKAGKLRAELLSQMDGSYALDAFDTHLVSRVKAPARWEYVSNIERLLAKQALLTAKQHLAEVEKKMQENGGAVDQNEGNYIIRVTEKKLKMGRGK